MKIRRYRPGEEAEIWSLYYDTTHYVNAQDYTDAQVHRWAPADADMEVWARRLVHTNPLVATEDGEIIGFAEFEPDGHIEFFYCHHERQRSGIGTALLRAIEAKARNAGIATLRAEVSTTAVAFFQAKGFEVVEERENIVCGSPARQYLMRKRLGL